LPEPTPHSALLSAAMEAHLRLLTELHGRKAALRWLRLLEDNLMDDEVLEKVVLFRGEEARALSRRNRRLALNWMRRMLPIFLRKMDEA